MMKKLLILAVALFSVSTLFVACEKAEHEPVYDATLTVVAEIISPSAGSSVVLSLADSAQPFVVEWSAAEYTLNSGDALPNPIYTLTAVYDTVEFELVNSIETSYSTIVYDFNTLLIANGVVAETESDITLKLSSTLPDVGYSESTSEIVIVMTAFTPPTPTPTGQDLFLIGDATTTGWDNTNTDLRFTLDEELNVYEITTTLAGEGTFLKAFEVEGQWAPQWGTDDTGTSETGPLVYRPTEEVDDPAAIPSPAEAGVYKITFDLVNLTYTIVPSVLPPPVGSPNLYLLGDATDAGWDNASTLIFGYDYTKEAYVIRANLAGGATFLKAVEVQGQWAPQWGTDDSGTSDAGPLVYRPTEEVDDPLAIPSPEVAGVYDITFDIVNLTYTIEPVE